MKPKELKSRDTSSSASFKNSRSSRSLCWGRSIRDVSITMSARSRTGARNSCSRAMPSLVDRCLPRGWMRRVLA